MTTATPSPSFLMLPNNESHNLLRQNNNNITVKRKLSSQSSNCCCCTKKNSCLQHNKRSASLPNLSIKIPKRKISVTQLVDQNGTNKNNTMIVENNSSTTLDTHTQQHNGQQHCHSNNDRRLSDRINLSATGTTTTITTPFTTPTPDGNFRRDTNDNNNNVRVPIIGYEVMEERAKFTVTKT